MADLRELIKMHSCRNHRQLKKITKPLLDILKTPHFCYFRIEQNGKFISITNDPEPLHYYYSEKKYLINPYLSHPRFFRSGCVISPTAFDSETLEVFHRQFNLYFFFIVLQQKGNSIEAFIFGNRDSDPTKTFHYISQLDLLQKFSSYFKREAKSIIDEALEENYNLKEAKKESFLSSDPNLSLSSQNPSTLEFLREISPLSKQEWRCLELFKQGNSAQSTASIMGLSPRTVEFYFQNIKTKLGCSTKWELLHW